MNGVGFTVALATGLLLGILLGMAIEKHELSRMGWRLCTHGESSVAVRKLPSGRIVTVRPAITTGCVLGR